MNRIKHPDLIDPTTYTLRRFSSENRANDRLAVYAVDGKGNVLGNTPFVPYVVKVADIP